ncbi:chromatin-remodeling protein SWR1 [Nakaseomyces bracarensis]|uniref:chromatin-remodeling protein SWR1 n=1 Tax=Nakaseomyces bracarensis TaxID=273131 RepID=UPI0038728AE7
MTKNPKNSNDQRTRALQQLTELKYEHDILTNELYHLKEFVSLVEFDPLYRESSESYNRFINENNLDWNKLFSNSEEGEDKLEEENTKRKVRKSTRQLRENGTDLEELTDAQKNLKVKLDALVDQKYDDMRKKYVNPPIDKKRPPTKKSHIKKEESLIVPSDSIKKETPTIKNDTNLKGSVTKDDIDMKIDNRKVFSKQGLYDSNEFKVLKNRNLKQNMELFQNDGINSESDYYFTTSSEEDEYFNKRKPPKKRRRINVILHPPKLAVTNPKNIAIPKYNTLDEYLDSFKMLEDEMTNQEYKSFIDEQKKIAAMIKKGINDGVLRYDSNTESVHPMTKKTTHIHYHHKPDPVQFMYKEQHLHTYQDHLVNQGIFMSKLVQNNRKARIAGAKKVAQMVEQHFKHIAGAEERRIKEEEKVKKALGRTMIQALRKRWTLAEKAYRVLKKDEDEQLKRIKGKEHLSRMLEKSSQLLGAQLNRPSEEKSDSDIDSDDDDEESSENFSSSSSETSDDEIQKLIEDQEHTDAVTSPESSDIKSTISDISNSKEPLDNPDAVSEKLETSNENEVGLEALISGGYSESENDRESSEDFDVDDSGTADSDDENLSDDSDVSMASSNDSKTNPKSKSEEKDSVENIIEEGKDADPLSVEDVPVPSLLRGDLRTYQKQGLNWLASLYNNRTNGILADEMGLGKTIQTISLLTYLACEKENWGPHLIIVPTSVLLNWEMEFKRFAPGFKVLTYYGTPQQRKEKRKGWNKPDAFHVCIVSYQLVVQDQHSFKRKKWQYMVLDEAHNIKNFRSTRWQALLNFNTQRRLLLTGTPLQNNIAELWSLLYFLMPKTIIDGQQVTGFADLDAFQQWFGRPVDKIIETGSSYEQDNEARRTVEKLHQVLRPYLLRRLKAEVEKQIPGKYEHVVYCKLSKRQRFLYDDFMSRAQTKATLASGNFMSIVNCLMQLRKVCNHPDLFEVRPIKTSFLFGESVMSCYSSLAKFMLRRIHENDNESVVNLSNLNLIITKNESDVTSHTLNSINRLACIQDFTDEVQNIRLQNKLDEIRRSNSSPVNFQNIDEFYESFSNERINESLDKIAFLGYINKLRCDKKVIYGKNLINLLASKSKGNNKWENIAAMDELMTPIQTRLINGKSTIEKFAVLTPSAVTSNVGELSLGLDDDCNLNKNLREDVLDSIVQLPNPFHQIQTKLTIAFPDKSLLQYDCGKLQKLAILLQQLKDNGHRALIFTQMTKVLDILEQFLNYHGYLYMRLDGATKIEDRQILTERFNTDPKVTVFILSSRSGGLGINLTGADTVIFYDSDWNPAMDKQCQDRCHRIGQTRDVHIYRFVSEHTIESNILKKANQKRQLDDVIIQKGEFTTDYFSKLSVRDLFGSEVVADLPSADTKPLLEAESDANKDPKKLEKLLAQAEDEDDVKAANLAMREVHVDDDDFQENENAKKLNILNGGDEEEEYDEFEGTNHVEEYMIRFIANGYYY